MELNNTKIKQTIIFTSESFLIYCNLLAVQYHIQLSVHESTDCMRYIDLHSTTNLKLSHEGLLDLSLGWRHRLWQLHITVIG